jgi:hypothetical protein
MQKNASLDQQFPNVEWLSHHIPKTAGSSLYHSFDHAFKYKDIQGVYPFNHLPKRLNTGQAVWVPGNIKLIHGHFRPHRNQLLQFPNAKRIIWIRDPVERVISLLSHVLRNKMIQTKFDEIKNQHSAGLKSFNALLFMMINDETLYSTTRIYETYLSGFDKTDFAFVGWVNYLSEDLTRLAEIMKIELSEYRVGAKPTLLHDDIDFEYYQNKLKSEYELIEKWI